MTSTSALIRRFGALAPTLKRSGWNVIPAKGKKPIIEGWQKGFDQKQVDRLAANGHANSNIGLLAKTFPGVDIDVSDEKCAAAIEGLALRMLGSAPIRIGTPPKRLLMYTTDAPFTKIKVFLEGPNGPKDANGKDYAVEILGEGQQYVIYGRHPDGHEYTWPNNDGPGETDIWDLTPITLDKIAKFIAAIPSALPEGWSVRENTRGRELVVGDADELALANYRAPLTDWDLDRFCSEILPHLDPDCSYEEWIRVGAAMHHQGQGAEDWLEAWDSWSANSDKYAEGLCSQKWDSFRGQRGQGVTTIASLIKKTTEARAIQAVSVRKNLESRIQATLDFDALTKEILKAVFEANLPEADTSLLLKKIAQKTRISVKALTQDGAKYRQVGASNQQMHLEAARAVIELLGRENLLFASSNLWRWSETGVWVLLTDREVKQLIHRVAANTKLTTNVVNSILDMVKTEVHREDITFDAHRTTINCVNGELEYLDYLGCWALRPHDREHYWTTQIPFAYDAEAKAPRFKKFLDEVFDGDNDATQKKLVVQEALGYTLLPSCHLEKFFMLIGSGANGKSVLLAVVEALLGPKLVTAVQPSQFDNRFQRGHLVGKLANIVTEIAQGGAIADDKLKSLVSGELTTAEMKFKDPFDFKPIATHWFGTNHLPRTRDFSDALFRRAILLSFNNRFEGERRDARLKEKLLAELPGIFNLALRGLSRLLNKGHFTDCPSSEIDKGEWRLETDQVQQFVQEMCVLDSNARAQSAELFAEYKNWAIAAGIQHALSRNTFSTRLRGLGFTTPRGTGGVRQFAGLRLEKSEFLG